MGRLRGRVWRQTALHVPGCLPPLQPAPHPGRYHRPGDPWPLYASLDRETMWAEWRHASDGAVHPDDDMRWVCALDVDLAVLDLRDPTVLRALGVAVPELIAPWSPDAPNEATLRVAAVARELGVDALIVPSAARDGGWNLAVLPQAFPQVRLASRRRRSAPTPHTAP